MTKELKMVRWTVGRGCFTKSIALHAVLFCLPVCAMKKTKNKNENALVSKVQALEYSIFFLTEDIVHKSVLPHMCFQAIGRFGQTCKTYQSHCNIEKIPASIFNYDEFTRILVCLARQGKEDAFTSLWNYNKYIRDAGIAGYCNKDIYSLLPNEKMKIYKKHYGSKSKREKRSNELRAVVIKKEDFDILRVILGGTTCTPCTLGSLIPMCGWNDSNIDILLEQLAGIDKETAIECLYKYGTKKLLSLLKERNYIDAEIEQKQLAKQVVVLRHYTRTTARNTRRRQSYRGGGPAYNGW